VQKVFRKPSKLTIKPSRFTLAMSGVAVAVASVLASNALVADPAPGGAAGAQGAFLASDTATAVHAKVLASDEGSLRRMYLTPNRLSGRTLRLRAKRAAERRAAARRAARKAAERAAARAAAAAAAQRAAASRAQAAPPAPSPPVVPSGSPQRIAMAMLGSYGWSSSQFGCLNSLWNAESGWNPAASNPGSGAYGIPQALPGSRMSSAGPDWQTNPATQIRWGLSYIKGVYGSPCAAWGHEEATGWY
jgi:hypothetical protein